VTRKQLDVVRLHSALDYVRAHRRISWKQVAAEAGLSASTLTRLGQGHAPDADGLCALMAWLGPALPLSRFTIDAPEERA
jgi:transcriptional regulator with XRE-family HTH domain